MKITKPTLLVDKAICENNIQNMAEKAEQANASLRPHFKTHHAAKIGNWYRQYGVSKCTASSVSMAGYFSENGWDDITIAFPYNPLESEEISKIATKGTLNILIESEESLKMAHQLITEKVGYFLKIDVGYHRTGIDPNNIALIEKLVASSSEKVSFKGFIAHAGHSYGLNEQDEIKALFKKSVDLLIPIKEKFGGIISYGDTPTCSLMDDLTPFDEIRAGNFVFYDWMQKEIGSCQTTDIAVCMACPVVAIHPEREEVVIYGGAVHFSKDVVENDGKKSYGKVVRLKNDGWETSVIGNVDKLSQEHGVVSVEKDSLSRLKVGDLIGVIPVHSCLAADLQGHYYTTEGERIEKIVKE